MSIQKISKEQLRRMGNQEGLILQGCGGDPQEWLDGINQILTDEGILKKGTRFEEAYTFQHDGVTCLVFPFKEGIGIIGKFSDKTSYANGFCLALALFASAYFFNLFATPQNWWCVVVFTILQCIVWRALIRTREICATIMSPKNILFMQCPYRTV